MVVRTLLGAAVAATLLIAPARAQLPDWWRVCREDTARSDDRIASCTSIIESKQEIPKNRSIAYNNRGLAWQKREHGPWPGYRDDLDRAIADFTEAIKLDPEFADAYFNRGGVWYERFTAGGGPAENKTNLGQAINDFNEVIRLDPKRTAAYRQRGLSYGGLGEHDRAIADFTEAIQLEPNSAALYYHRGNAWADKGEFKRAIADLTAAIRLDPKDAIAYGRRAETWLALEEYDRAIADYTQTIRFGQEIYERHYFDRGYAYFLRGNFAAAATDFHRAVQLLPKRSSRIRDDLAMFRFVARARSGAIQQARSELSGFRQRIYPGLHALLLGRGRPEQAFEDDFDVPDRCVVAFFVGQWHLVRGERRAARRHLQSAASNDCDETDIKRAAVVELKRLGR